MLFSVITVTYNAEKTLERTILSVTEQSHRDEIEYIIIDGASKDKTVDIIQKHQKNIDKWISEPDNGLYDAMNKGLDLASGKYVWFINAGDEIHSKETVKKLTDSLKIYDITPDVIYGETQIIDGKGNPIGPRRLKASKALSPKDFRWGMLVSHQSFLVKKDGCPYYNTRLRYVADFEWCIHCLKHAKTIMNSNLVLSNYMEEGLSTLNRKASLKERYQVMKEQYGTTSTVLFHLWFAIRFYTSKLIFGRV